MISPAPNMIMPLGMNDTWRGFLWQVLSNGHFVEVRGLDTKEIMGAHTVIPMREAILTVPERKLGYKFMCAEAHWILTGDSRVCTIAPYSKVISKFSDDGITFQGAYGPKISDQMDYVVETLLKDKYSRQAVINIWRENPGPSKDIPCTLSLQFIWRKSQIHCVATMRSSDLWLGFPYDMFNFTMITTQVGLRLRESTNKPIDLGFLVFNAGSLHLYTDRMEEYQKCRHSGSNWVIYPISLSMFNTPDEHIDQLGYLKDMHLDDCTSTFLVDEMEGWYAKTK